MRAIIAPLPQLHHTPSLCLLSTLFPLTLRANTPLLRPFHSGCIRAQKPVSSRAPSELRELLSTAELGRPLIFTSTSTDSYLNLSIEDYLFRNSHLSTRILFFYTNRPCVVIGRNQNPWLECDIRRLQDGLSKDGTHKVPIDLVRRRSGGGTVFHDLGNLNYSVIVPNDKDFNRQKHAEMVVRALNRLDNLDSGTEVKVNERHDIVMRRREEQDWLKISGSAFKLSRGRALHHGTLLLHSPHLQLISELLNSPGRGHILAKGVESVRSKVANLAWSPKAADAPKIKESVINKVSNEFIDLYGNPDATTPQDRLITISDEDPDEKDTLGIRSGVSELTSNEWRFGQTPRFDFDSGLLDGIQLRFNVGRGGEIENLHILSDSPRPRSERQVDLKERIQLHDIESWSDVLRRAHLYAKATDGDQSLLQELGTKAAQKGALLRLLERTFPNYTS